MAIEADMDESLLNDYKSENILLRARRNKIACVIAFIFMPVGAAFDYLSSPVQLWDLLGIRIIVSATVIGLYLLQLSKSYRDRAELISMMLTVVLNSSFCIVMYLTDGVDSRYHATLSLMILGGGLLMAWTLYETIFISVFTLVIYTFSAYMHYLYIDHVARWEQLFSNLYLILLSGVIAGASSHFYTNARMNDFSLRRQLDMRNKELEELDRMKSRFFANISHELRTPLTLILSPIQDLLQSTSSFDDNVKHLLKTAHDNALRLLRLVNELLEVIKLEEGKMNYEGEDVEIGNFIAAMVDSMRHLAESQNISLIKNLSSQTNIITADSYMLERIFINLIGNAIKFTSAGGTINVSEEVINDNVVIRVSDTGIGISEEDLPYIFDRFHQAGNSSTHRSQGTGLGLALVRELTEIMQGQISVTSKLGHGTTMQLTFPLLKIEASPNAIPAGNTEDDNNSMFQPIIGKDAGLTRNQPAPATITELPPGDDPLVLVVDDEPDIRNYLVNTLEKNYRVIKALDGEQALNYAKKFKPEFILLDLMLPKIDGLEVCRTLKHDPETRHIKIMLLTARIDEEAKISALNNGADDFLTKPFSKVEVQTRLRNLLQTANLENSLRIHNRELEETLTELRQTQAQLIHSEKINALGKLTAGLLHEINNPLNYALTALQMIKREPVFNEDEVLHEIFQDIDEGMNRIKSIICELQVFAHPAEANKHGTFSIKDAITSALRFTANELRDIHVTQNLHQEEEVIGSRGSIVQILINLLTNSSKAIAAVSTREKRKGEITITTENRDSRLYIHVRDNGIGIEKEVIHNIFDPFYTSRDVGEGMGLGLSICHTIVRNHGGQLTVTSEHGLWTEFCFDLPIAVEADSSEELKLHAVK